MKLLNLTQVDDFEYNDNEDRIEVLVYGDIEVSSCELELLRKRLGFCIWGIISREGIVGSLEQANDKSR